jgi:hypothetical protein
VINFQKTKGGAAANPANNNQQATHQQKTAKQQTNLLQPRVEKYGRVRISPITPLTITFHFGHTLTEVLSTGQPTSCHFMFVWKENLLQKRIRSAFFSLLQFLVLVRQLCIPLFYAP